LAVKSLDRRHRTRDNNSIPNEVAILRQLPRHINIIQYEAFYQSQATDHPDCILFEYLPALDLYELRDSSYDLGRNGIFSEKFMWSVYSQLCAALAFLHEGIGAPPGTNSDWWKPILHRDIKIENVFIKSLGDQHDWSSIVIKLGDFGQACIYNQDDCILPRGIGTPDCWPPEITLQAREYGPEADVWAVGSVIHELAHGFPPIESVMATEHYILAERRDLLPERWTEYPQDRRNWFFRVMALRKPLPINVPPVFQAPDSRSHRPCPRYTDSLNACMMFALAWRKSERPAAGVLKREVDAGYAAFLYEELERENDMLVEEEGGQNADTWGEGL
jgi:NIMA (never in mitosis gene a)-related kinase